MTIVTTFTANRDNNVNIQNVNSFGYFPFKYYSKRRCVKYFLIGRNIFITLFSFFYDMYLYLSRFHSLHVNKWIVKAYTQTLAHAHTCIWSELDKLKGFCYTFHLINGKQSDVTVEVWQHSTLLEFPSLWKTRRQVPRGFKDRRHRLLIDGDWESNVYLHILLS